MGKKNVQKEITELGPWYQKVNIHGIPTIRKGQPYSANIPSTKVWDHIKQFIPSSLDGMRVLDLGSNAGFYSLHMSLLGAHKVIGVEMNNTFFNQAQYLKKYYEDINKKKLNVEFIQKNISDLDFTELGKFDYVLALSIIYHIGKHKYGKYTKGALNEQVRVLKEIAKNTKHFIVGTRNKEKNSVHYYNRVFKKLGFKDLKVISGGKRSWVLYGR